MRQSGLVRVGIAAFLGLLALLWGAPSVASVAARPTASIAGTTVATIDVGKQPWNLALDSANRKLFLQDATTDSVVVIDTSTNAVVDSFQGPAGTFNLILDTARGRLYAMSGSQSDGPGLVTIIDANSYAILATVRLSGEANAPAFDARRGLLYVPLANADTGAGSVAIVDVTRARVKKTVRVGRYPWAVALDDSGKRLYVSGEKPARVYAIDVPSGRVLAAIKVPESPQYIVVDSPHSRAYAVRSTGLTVVNMRTNRVVATVSMGVGVEGTAPVLDSAARLMYVVGADLNEVDVVDTRTNKIPTVIPLGEQYGESVMLDAAAARLYVADFDEGMGHTLSVIDTQRRVLLGAIPVGKGPQLPTLDAATSRLYVPNWVSGSVTVIDTTKVP